MKYWEKTETSLNCNFLQLLNLRELLRGDIESLFLRLTLLFDDHRQLPPMLSY